MNFSQKDGSGTEEDHVKELTDQYPNLIVSTNRAYDGLFTVIRDVTTPTASFVHHADRLMRILAEEALALLPSRPPPCHYATPCASDVPGRLPAPPSSLTAVSIIRGGDALLETVRSLLPDLGSVGKILIQRDEESADKHAVLYYHKLPRDIAREDGAVLLCDPMLGTGGSAMAALEVLVKQNGVDPARIVFCNLLCVREGVERVLGAYPELKIVTACVDPILNEKKYLVPGIGDFGDRYFGTT